MVKNPILTGMNPDPSACTDGQRYYIATSTFEWYPGIKIYVSDDLANWDLVARPLTTKQVNLKGIPDSAGVWAPGLRYFDGKFWLTYSVMHQIDGVYKDLRNYVVTAEHVEDEWSDPIFIGAQGFDPSLFQDDDGQIYLVSQNWDYRQTYLHQKFNGILMQKFDDEKKTLVGPSKRIFTGSPQGGTEGPSIFRHNGYYYLLMAEGGSGRHHSITVARSQRVTGPYKLSPNVTLLTAFNADDQPIQKAGHGNLIETPDGRTFLVHLMSRYLPGTGMSMLGRETAIEEITWQDDWPILKGGGQAPAEVVEDLPRVTPESTYETDFSGGLDLSWSSLRQPSLQKKSQEVGLVLKADESLSSLLSQAMVVRSWQAFSFETTATLSFEPQSFRHQAGLVLYYNTKNWLFLYVSHDEITDRRILNLQMAKQGHITEPSNGLYAYLPDNGDVQLRFVVATGVAHAYYQVKADGFQSFGRHIDVSFLSDEGVGGWGFTGAMIGLTAIDTDRKDTTATFSHFEMKTTEEKL
ncbi:glycoside hydrolase family 43 protein [Lacticaseibacillus chiayiensis]|uniref:glycoside hydrolase family 43 protein n=1 Tax=Lacticaseibacillus chiayiensis TaxID=2100821 RepID=UPI003C70DFB1